jgi:hypothetical protein
MPPYLTRKAVAKRYSRTVRTVDRWWKDGRLPPPVFPVGPGKPFADLEQLEAAERTVIAQPVQRSALFTDVKPAA